MKRNELRNKKNNLQFYSDYLEITKITLSQQLHRVISNLEDLKKIKNANHHLLNLMSEKWLKSYKNYYIKNDTYPSFYILFDPEKNDDVSKFAFSKLEEEIKKRIKPNDFVATVGLKTAHLAQKHNYQIVENFSYTEALEVDKFSEKIASLIDIGVKNNVIGQVTLIYSKIDIITKRLVQKELYPLDIKDVEMRSDEVDSDGVPIIREDNASHEWTQQYVDIINNINLKTTQWLPDVANFYNLFAKSIFKGLIFELEAEKEIADLRIQLAINEEKKKSLDEKLSDLNRMWNRVRKEEITLQSLILFSAFHGKKNDEEQNFYYDKYRKFVSDMRERAT